MKRYNFIEYFILALSVVCIPIALADPLTVSILATSNTAFNTVSSASFNITIPEDVNKGALVVATQARDQSNNSAGVTVSTLTANSVTMTEAKTIYKIDNPGDPYALGSELWYYLSPDAGEYQIDITFGGGINSGTAVAMLLENIDQDNPINSTASVSVDQDDANAVTTVDLTTEFPGVFGIDSFYDTASTGATAGEDQTRLYSGIPYVYGNNTSGVSYKDDMSTAGNYTFSYTVSPTNSTSVLSVVGFKPTLPATVPQVTAFVMPSLTRSYETAITTLTYSVESGSVVGWYLSESAETPAYDAEGWLSSEPSTFTFSDDGEKTVYVWVKSDNDDVSYSDSETVNVKTLTGYSSGVWVNNGEDKVRRDEVRYLDNEKYGDGSTNNEIWDGTTIRIKEAANAFSNFSVYIEAGESDLTNITVEMSDLVNGENVINCGERETDELFDFTLTDIEMFYVKYLQILGVRGGTEYGVATWPENRFVPSMQRPNTPEWKTSAAYPPGYYKDMANSETYWYDRSGADKFYPEILVPIELEPTFNITIGESQQIWVDIWIAKDTPAGTYTGAFTVKDDDVTIASIPIELEVYDFDLPDIKNLQTFGYFEWTHIMSRYMDNLEYYPEYSSKSESEKNRLVEIWRFHNFMLHRHYINFASEICGCGVSNSVPATDYQDFYRALNGSLFTDTYGYNGPGINSGQSIYVIGTYGRWQNTTPYGGFFTDTIANLGDEAAATQLCAALDSCYTNLESVNTGIKKQLWLVDEPWTQAAYDAIDKYSGWAKECTGGGENIQMWATGSMEDSIRFNSSNIDINIDRGGRRDNWNRLAENSPYNYVYGWKWNEEQWDAAGNEMQTYTAPEDLTRGYFRQGWSLFVEDINWNMIWHMGLYENNEGGQKHWKDDTDLFHQASTLGPSTPGLKGTLDIVGNQTNCANYSDSAGMVFKIEIDGTGTPDTFKWSLDDGATWEETGVAITGEFQSLGGYEAIKWDSTTGHELEYSTGWTSKWSAIYGQATYGNGTGVQVFPGTDYVYPEDSYGINGPLASIRLKSYRKAIQDNEYLKLASDLCSSCVNPILSSLGIIDWQDDIYDWSNIGYGGDGSGWNESAIDIGSFDDFERARAKLANIILGTNPPSEFKGSLNGLSK